MLQSAALCKASLGNSGPGGQHAHHGVKKTGATSFSCRSGSPLLSLSCWFCDHHIPLAWTCPNSRSHSVFLPCCFIGPVRGYVPPFQLLPGAARCGDRVRRRWGRCRGQAGTRGEVLRCRAVFNSPLCSFPCVRNNRSSPKQLTCWSQNLEKTL